MTRALRRVRLALRLLGLFAVAFGVTSLLVLWLGRDGGPDIADVEGDAIGVDELVVASTGGPVEAIVTGYVFVGEHRAILCSARDREDPPYCDGSVVDLERIDLSRLDLVHPENAPSYSRDEVTVAGSLEFGVFTVLEILQ